METFDPTREPAPAPPAPAPDVTPPEPKPEPSEEPADSHLAPLESEDDARFLDPSDPRRIKVEEKLGKKFD